MSIMKPLIETTNVTINNTFTVTTGHASVIQKGNVTKSNIYGLQLWDNGKNIRVYRGPKSSSSTLNKLIFNGTSSAGGHTQTWEFSGRSNNWFVGTKPKDLDNNVLWDLQIARVDITKKTNYTSNTDLKRLAALNTGGPFPYGKNINGRTLQRAEAALSPDYSTMLIATVDNYGTGYFTQYNTSTIHSELDKAPDYVDISTIPYIKEKSFKIDNFYNKDGGAEVIVNSIQGYDLDNEGNIYISSQQSPTIDKKTGKITTHHKQIVTIPHDSYENSSQWHTLNLSKNKVVDKSGLHSELEGIQIISKNHCYLTVAYHAKSKTSNSLYTSQNIIYELDWN